MKSYIKPFLYASLTGDVNRKTNVAVSFILRSYSSAYSEDFIGSWRAIGTIRGGLIERTEYKVEYFYGNGEYFSSDRKIDFGGINLDLLYEITKKIKATLSYYYSQYGSNRDGEGYSKNAVTVGLKAFF